VQGIKARIAGGESISIYQVQKEYEKHTGRLRTRAGILKLLKSQQWDELHRSRTGGSIQ
jgi:hypothetical protein